MARIAHISDLHLIEDSWRKRCIVDRARLSFLSFGRPLDREARRRRFANALALAIAGGCDHVILTGDLTEDGCDAQFEVLAELLQESGIDPARVTLVPGNHDLYWGASAWARAIDGPLRAYRETSTLNVPISLGDVTILPVSTAVHQTPLRSAGYLLDDAFDAVRRAAEDTKRDVAPLLLAMHHPPYRHQVGPLQWIDGLQRADRLSAALRLHHHVFVAHGHTHVRTNHAFVEGARARIFSPYAIAIRAGAFRLYEASCRRVVPLDDGGSWADQQRKPEVPAFSEPALVRC